MAKTFRYQHLRTDSSGAQPAPSIIREGELAVNFAKDGEKIFLKNSKGEIVKFITEAQIDAKIQSQSGTTDGKIQALSGAIDTLDTKVDGVSGAASTAIGAEETRAIGVETGLRTDVDTVSGSVATEKSRAEGAEAGLRSDIETVSGNVASEESRAKGIEGGLRTDVNTVSGAVGAEETRAINIETGLRTDVNTVSGNLATEISNRVAQDKAIIDSFVYDKNAKTITLSDGTNTSTISTDDFVKDGMIDSVETQTSGSTTVLVITWNTDAGKEQTILDIGDVFEADNYYTKTETSGATELSTAFGEKLAISDFNSYSSTTKGVIDEKLAITAFETYSGATKDAIDAKLATNDFNSYSSTTKDAINEKLAITAFETYSAATEGAINSKLATNDFNAYSGVTDALIGTKLAKDDFNTYSGATKDAIDSKAAQSDLTTLSDTVTAHTADTTIHVTSEDKSTWSAKQDALVSGTNIKTVAGETVLGSGNVEIGIADIKTNDVADFTISGDTIILDAGYFTEFI